MVHHINRTQHKHIVTIENPIEFLHRDLNCSITQREVGVDTGQPGGRRARGAAAGSRRGRDRRDGRRRNDRHRDQGRGDRPPRHRDDAHARRGDHDRADPRDPAARGARDRAHAARRGAARDHLPAAAAAEGREGPRAGRRSPDRHAGRPRVPQGRHPLGDLKKLMADGRKSIGMQTFEQHTADLVEAGLITAETAKAAVSLSAPSAPTTSQARIQAGPVRLSRPRVPTLDRTMQRCWRSARGRLRGRGRPRGNSSPPISRRWATASSSSASPSFPPALNGFPLFGAGLGGLGLLQLPLLTGARVPGWAALPVLLAGLAALDRSCPSASVRAGSRSARRARTQT